MWNNGMRRGKRRTFALTNFDNEQTLTRRFLGVEEERYRVESSSDWRLREREKNFGRVIEREDDRYFAID